MARLQAPTRPGLVTRLTQRIATRRYGRELEPLAAEAHWPAWLLGHGALELAFERSSAVPERLIALVEMKAAALTGCEWCLDFGSHVGRTQGVGDADLRALPHYADSDVFDADDKLVLEYAEAITRTPVDVSDELFDRLRARFDERQIVELTAAAAIENLRSRFNWALGIGSQGFSKGSVCALPEPAAVTPS